MKEAAKDQFSNLWNKWKSETFEKTVMEMT